MKNIVFIEIFYNCRYGYLDLEYLVWVKDELGVKGILEDWWIEEKWCYFLCNGKN